MAILFVVIYFLVAFIAAVSLTVFFERNKFTRDLEDVPYLSIIWPITFFLLITYFAFTLSTSLAHKAVSKLFDE